VLVVIQLVKNPLLLWNPKIYYRMSTKHSAGLCPEPVESVQQFRTLLSRHILSLSIHLRLGLPKIFRPKFYISSYIPYMWCLSSLLKDIVSTHREDTCISS